MNTKSIQLYTDFERAKQVVLEIIRCAGGSVTCKTKVFKMFYFAHLIYAKNHPDYLSEWPMVRMPHGPGIGESERLFSALQRDGLLEVREAPVGPYTAYEYRSHTDQIPPGLSPQAIEAIRQAVEFASNKSASELSELTHEFSNSWKNSMDGQELDIYVDLFTEEAYAEVKRRAAEGAADLKAVFG